MKKIYTVLLISLMICGIYAQPGTKLVEVPEYGTNTNSNKYNDVEKEKGQIIPSSVLNNSYPGSTGFLKSSNLYAIIRSSVGVGGSSKTFSTNDKNYNVSQSIGQASVIGTYDKNEHTLLQGYQQPLISIHIVPTPIEHNLKATVYPNPFQQSVNVTFDDRITNDIFVILSDMMGNIIVSQKLPASQLINLQLDHIPHGLYVLNVKIGNKQFIAKITKQ